MPRKPDPDAPYVSQIDVPASVDMHLFTASRTLHFRKVPGDYDLMVYQSSQSISSATRSSSQSG